MFLAGIANSTAARVRWEAGGHLIQYFTDPERRGLELNPSSAKKKKKKKKKGNSGGSLCDVEDSRVSVLSRPILFLPGASSPFFFLFFFSFPIERFKGESVRLLTGCHPVT